MGFEQQAVRETETREAKEAEQLDVGRFRAEGVIRAFEVKKIEFYLFRGHAWIKTPSEARADREVGRAKVVAEVERYGSTLFGGRFDPDAEYFENDSCLDRVWAHLEREGVDFGSRPDTLVSVYMDRLRERYERVLRATLCGDATRELEDLRKEVVVMFKYREQSYRGTHVDRQSHSRKEGQIIDVLKIIDTLLGRDEWHGKGFGSERMPKEVEVPALGIGFSDYLTSTGAPVSIDHVPNGALVYLEQVGTVGRCIRKEDGSSAVEIIMEPVRKSTGVGMPNPSITVDRVTGNVYLPDLLAGLPEKEEAEKLALYSALARSLELRGVQHVETHIFNQPFLFQAILLEAWTLPHLQGFQVETKPVADMMNKDFEYFRKRYPYYSFVFNGDVLEEEYPKNSPGHKMRGFHFIPKGLRFDHPAFLHCIVPPPIRTRILQWIEGLGPEKKVAIFGTKDPAQFFVSAPEDFVV